MLLKSNCTQCAASIEFDSKLMGSVISCPTCQRPTKLTLMDVPPAESPRPGKPFSLAAEPSVTNGTPSAALQTLRANTHYPQLRRLIDLLQILAFVFAGLSAIAVVIELASLHQAAQELNRLSQVTGINFSEEGTSNPLLVPFICLWFFGLFSPVWFVLAAFFGKQVGHLLVDIADCHLQQQAGNK